MSTQRIVLVAILVFMVFFPVATWLEEHSSGFEAYSASTPEYVVSTEATVPEASPGNVGKGINIPWMPETVRWWYPHILESANKQGVIDPEVSAIVVLIESGGYPLANSSSPPEFPDGARCLMQIMRATAIETAGTYGPESFNYDLNIWDPQTCIWLGTNYLANQMASFGQENDPGWNSSVKRAGGAYNGGPGAVIKNSYSAETLKYMYWIEGMWRERHQPDSETYREWLALGGQHLVDQAWSWYNNGGSAHVP